MMRRTAVLAVILIAVSSFAFADLELRVVDAASGTASVTVRAGETFTYQIEAELGADGGQGLALLRFDLALPGGGLAPVTVPAGSALASFVPPPGYSPNPAGYGGVAAGDTLTQAGGAQNVFRHGAWQCDADRDCPASGTCNGGLCSQVAGLPTAPLVLGVALAGSPAVAGEGTALAPQAAGTYQLAVIGARATVIATDATGDPVWRTEPVATITTRALEIVVEEGGGQPPEAIPTAGPVGLAVLIAFLALAGVLLLRRRR